MKVDFTGWHYLSALLRAETWESFHIRERVQVQLPREPKQANLGNNRPVDILASVFTLIIGSRHGFNGKCAGEMFPPNTNSTCSAPSISRRNVFALEQRCLQMWCCNLIRWSSRKRQNGTTCPNRISPLAMCVSEIWNVYPHKRHSGNDE